MYVKELKAISIISLTGILYLSVLLFGYHNEARIYRDKYESCQKDLTISKNTQQFEDNRLFDLLQNTQSVLVQPAEPTPAKE